MHTRSQTRAMDAMERFGYEQPFQAQLECIDQPIKYTLLDGRAFTFANCHFTWIDIRDGQRKYSLLRDIWGLAREIAQKTGIPEDDQILFNTDTGERLNDDYYTPICISGTVPSLPHHWTWDGDIPRDLANVLVMSK